AHPPGHCRIGAASGEPIGCGLSRMHGTAAGVSGAQARRHVRDRRRPLHQFHRAAYPCGIRIRHQGCMNKPRRPRWLIALGVAGVCAAACGAAPPPTGLQRDVVFNLPAPLARNGELLRRLVSPLHALDMQREMAGNPEALEASPLAPSRQHFALYVPTSPAPATGYMLLVFVPPWNDARIPVEWIPVLDRNQVIFATAAGSGNDANVLDHREPLALLAAYNV